MHHTLTKGSGVNFGGSRVNEDRINGGKGADSKKASISIECPTCARQIPVRSGSRVGRCSACRTSVILWRCPACGVEVNMTLSKDSAKCSGCGAVINSPRSKGEHIRVRCSLCHEEYWDPYGGMGTCPFCHIMRPPEECPGCGGQSLVLNKMGKGGHTTYFCLYCVDEYMMRTCKTCGERFIGAMEYGDHCNKCK